MGDDFLAVLINFEFEKLWTILILYNAYKRVRQSHIMFVLILQIDKSNITMLFYINVGSKSEGTEMYTTFVH